MGSGTSSGKTSVASVATGQVSEAQQQTNDYLNRISKLDTIAALNSVVEEAANNDVISNQQYQTIYDAAIKKIQTYRG